MNDFSEAVLVSFRFGGTGKAARAFPTRKYPNGHSGLGEIPT